MQIIALNVYSLTKKTLGIQDNKLFLQQYRFKHDVTFPFRVFLTCTLTDSKTFEEICEFDTNPR